MKIQSTLDNVSMGDAKIKRKDQVKTLDNLCPGVKINDKTMHVDPMVLFTCLTALVQHKDDMIDCFQFELAPEPTSWFHAETSQISIAQLSSGYGRSSG